MGDTTGGVPVILCCSHLSAGTPRSQPCSVTPSSSLCHHTLLMAQRCPQPCTTQPHVPQPPYYRVPCPHTPLAQRLAA